MREVIEDLSKIRVRYMELAIKMRSEDPYFSYAAFRTSENMAKAEEALKREIPEEAEIEGDKNGHFWVCPECHGTIGHRDHYCKHCGKKITWGEKE